MKVNRSSSSNLRFLFGSVFFFAVLLLTMVLFTYYAMSEAAKKPALQMFSYTISIDENLKGKACDVLFDDSLLFSSKAAFPTSPLLISRRVVCDTVFNDGKPDVQERVLFSSESLIRVIDSESNDTLSVKVGNNSRINILGQDGKMSVILSE